MSNRMRQLLFLGLLIADVLILPAFTSQGAKAQELIWWTTHAMLKVRPTDAPPAGNNQGVELFAARNEFESFQIIFTSKRRDVEKIDVQVSDLVEPSGGVIASKNAMIYLERYLNLRSSSSVEGGAGEWPDPLIPRVDRYTGERRNAFPFSLRRSRNQPLWIEIYVPPSTPPGLYSGRLTVTAQGLPAISIPVSLKVWDFILPSTSSLKTSFGLSGLTALKQHRGRYTNESELHDITFLYAKAALWHRISTHGGTMYPPRYTGTGQNLRVDWAQYDQEVEPFLDGTVFTKDEPLFGARATTIDLRVHKQAAGEELVSYWREWVKHFTERGWLDRLFYYVWDEPPSQTFPQVAERAALARRADARIRNLVTTPFDPSLRTVIDIWAPLINCLESKPGFPGFCDRTTPRTVYDPEIERGKGLWWYQSCASHGCEGSGGNYFRGWPSYAVDVPAMANRIMSWLTWNYKVEGELYFSMNEAYAQDSDPWDNIYLFGGNGDGTLFYPGRPKQIGGSKDVPIESIRLKLIRDGLEDYEYLFLLSKLGLSDFADEQVSRIVANAHQWERDPEKLYAARRTLGEKLSEKFSEE
ncbi:MAG: DUF4091 domain-containing protein [Acidobacteria bacterium]|nr:DUF4091 domain-containing protein [Acidobacteriota bacterium]